MGTFETHRDHSIDCNRFVQLNLTTYHLTTVVGLDVVGQKELNYPEKEMHEDQKEAGERGHWSMK